MTKMTRGDKALLEGLVSRYGKKALLKETSETPKQLNIEEAKQALDELNDKYVPAYGVADTVGGEILRAYTRLVYRAYNDGDVPGYGYGNETCNSSLRYLRDFSIFSSLYPKNEDAFVWMKTLDEIAPSLHAWLTTGEDAKFFDISNSFDSREASDEDRRLAMADEYEEDDYEYEEDDWFDPYNDEENDDDLLDD